MTNKIQRAWYVERLKRIGIVEKGTNATSKDGYTSDWKSITESKDLRIYAISRDSDILINALGNTFLQIPDEYHNVLVSKVISDGYKQGQRFDGEKALFFDNEYRLGLKEAKKFSKSAYQTTGRITPHEF